MPIQIESFGGPPIWFFRKHCSYITSKIMLTSVEALRRKKILNFVHTFKKTENIPAFQFLMLETVNRCNGKCSFCPANIHDEKRKFQKMDDKLIDKILDELAEQDWKGTVFPQVNNEPFVDTRITDIIKKIRFRLPDCKICVITNGTLLTIERLKEIALYVDELVINDYSDKYTLSSHCREVFKYVKENPDYFKSIDIFIRRRYAGEILATRAGNAPNKPKKNNKITAPCIYPFTDMVIVPDGRVVMCCNDCSEVTAMGNAYEQSLWDIWNGKSFVELRASMMGGRIQVPFCVDCDVIDAGSREKAIDGKG